MIRRWFGGGLWRTGCLRFSVVFIVHVRNVPSIACRSVRNKDDNVVLRNHVEGLSSICARYEWVEGVEFPRLHSAQNFSGHFVTSAVSKFGGSLPRMCWLMGVKVVLLPPFVCSDHPTDSARLCRPKIHYADGGFGAA